MTQVEIVICPNCKGLGYMTHHEITCYHRNEYDVIETECHKCDGKGRLWQTIKTEFEKL